MVSLQNSNLELKDLLVDALEQEIKSGNIKVILWLAEKMNVVTHKNSESDNDIATILENLTPSELMEYQRLSDE